MSAVPEASAERVLLVEFLAHLRHGHYMARLKEIAEALAEDGHEVHVLSAEGLAVESEGGGIEGVTALHRPRGLWARALDFGLALWPPFVENERPSKRSIPRRLLGIPLIQIAAVRIVARCARSLGGPAPVRVIVMTPRIQFGWACVWAPLDARWLIHAPFSPPVPLSRRTSTWGSALARRRERRRRAAGGAIGLACGGSNRTVGWAARHPWTTIGAVPIAGTVPVQPIPRETARAALSLDPDAWIAIHFGVAHRGKDLRTVLLAFAGDDAPGELLIAGSRNQEAFRLTCEEHPDLDFPHVQVMDGAQTDETKRILHSAADLVILSLKAGRTGDSANLTDAISYGLPVCCTDGTYVGGLVRTYDLGLTFPAGDAVALRRAVHDLRGIALDPTAHERFREDHSTERVARQLLELAIDPP